MAEIMPCTPQRGNMPSVQETLYSTSASTSFLDSGLRILQSCLPAAFLSKSHPGYGIFHRLLPSAIQLITAILSLSSPSPRHAPREESQQLPHTRLKRFTHCLLHPYNSFPERSHSQLPHSRLKRGSSHASLYDTHYCSSFSLLTTLLKVRLVARPSLLHYHGSLHSPTCSRPAHCLPVAALRSVSLQVSRFSLLTIHFKARLTADLSLIFLRLLRVGIIAGYLLPFLRLLRVQLTAGYLLLFSRRLRGRLTTSHHLLRSHGPFKIRFIAGNPLLLTRLLWDPIHSRPSPSRFSRLPSDSPARNKLNTSHCSAENIPKNFLTV
ncbi:hypothetical protein NA56DRAFT_712470 [Hyaloscypha hepaticicola]|uniref:Uncharacterized protein n=1 Tax=Hyaloscypha hepaticicola TaxID=2082293 RepID=A0A2J6PG63_9HELO|nr:hypothetical protein NA56DRAFT_712470 [Hyaloscypha hepaticicola]